MVSYLGVLFFQEPFPDLATIWEKVKPNLFLFV